VGAFAAGNPALLKKTNIDYVKPERVSFELVVHLYQAFL
jgi:hypothetical protein